MALILSCAQRNGGINGRDNPFDPGGNDYSQHQRPVVTSTTPKHVQWLSYDSASARGAVLLTYSAFDPDKGDPLSFVVRAASDTGFRWSAPIYQGLDSGCIVSGVALGAKWRYSIIAINMYSRRDTVVDSFTVPMHAPSRAPWGLTATSDTGAIAVARQGSAAKYVVFRSDSLGRVPSAIDTTTTRALRDSGLADGMYYYRVASQDSTGLNFGGDTAWALKYSQSMASSAPYNLVVSSISDTIRLTWYGSSYSYFTVFRARKSTGPYVQWAVSHGTSIIDTGITSTDSLYYRVAAVSASGESRFYSPLSVSAGSRRAGLTAPGMNAASQGTYRDSVVFSWSSVSGATGYIIHRGLSYSDPGVAIDTVGGSVLTYADIPISDTTWYYTVSSFDGVSTGPASYAISGYIVKVPHALREDTTSGNGATDSTIRLTWTAPYSGYYAVYRSVNGTTFSRIDTMTGSSNPAYLDTSIATRNAVRYFVRYRTTSGVWGRGSDTIAARVKPVPPCSLVVTPYPDSVTIRWQRSSAADQYRVYRSYSSSNNGLTLDTTVLDTHITITADIDTPQYFRIVAYNTLGGQNVFAGTPNVLVHKLVPVTQQMHIATAESRADCISLYWDRPQYVTGFRVYRATGSTSDTTLFALIDSTRDTSFLDTVPDLGLYSYFVKPINLAGIGRRSNILTGQQRAAVSPPSSVTASDGSTSNAIIVQWTRSLGARGYKVYRALTASDLAADYMLRGVDSTDTTFSDSVSSDSIYYYRVKAYTDLGDGVLGTARDGGWRKPASAPDSCSGVQCTATPTTITVSWTAPAAGTRYNGFVVLRGEAVSGPFVALDTLPTTPLTFTDQTPTSHTCPEQSYYTVTAINAVGESARPTAVGTCRQ